MEILEDVDWQFVSTSIKTLPLFLQHDTIVAIVVAGKSTSTISLWTCCCLFLQLPRQPHLAEQLSCLPLCCPVSCGLKHQRAAGQAVREEVGGACLQELPEAAEGKLESLLQGRGVAIMVNNMNS